MLANIIANRIRNEGPISFCDFMEMSLYYPGHGYYTSAKEKIGAQGDFFTAPSFHPLFGRLVAVQIEEMWRLMGEQEFTIVEFGAGPGHLCQAILDHMQERGLYDHVHYYIIEKSPAMIATARARLPAKVGWIGSLDEIGRIRGCILSNELVDNFAVHRVAVRGGLHEIWVDHQHDFVEIAQPASDELKAYLEELKLNLPDGFVGEINLQATHWMHDIASHLEKGFVLTIDYGYPSSELFDEFRKNGTLRCFYKHRAHHAPYRFIGNQDITSHVNFSALCLFGHKQGLQYCGFTNQAQFLLRLGFYEVLKKMQTGNDREDLRAEQWLTRLLLHDMGHKFKVLIQHRNVDIHTLTGLRTRAA